MKTIQEGWESYKEAVLDPEKSALRFVPIDTLLRLAFFGGAGWMLNGVMGDEPEPTQEEVDRITEEIRRS